MNNHDQISFEKKLFPILKCPRCQASTLQLVDRQTKQWNPSINLWEKDISCAQCNSLYPITDDFIPIMWTLPIQNYLKNQVQPKDTAEALVANIAIYDSISDDYNEYSRRNSDLETRLINSAKRLLPQKSLAEKYHLDFGCGPGHVLGWLKDFHLTQVGLDVSIINLRNARRQTGTLVVCGDATNMPFIDGSFDLVTESSALHHIEDWQSCLKESCRVTKALGGVIIDSEPSKDQMDWSWIAIKIFELRFVPYQILSYLLPNSRFYLFRDRKEAKLNMLAEIHHQPKTGFPVDEVVSVFSDCGFSCEVVLSPSSDLATVSKPSKRHILISLLSFRNPWDSRYGSFIALAQKHESLFT
jgi:ubiquinone/menaquinone biosynthesis C-methylase UbiE/uncharacterized protein YbaR (Trm112 family)